MSAMALRSKDLIKLPKFDAGFCFHRSTVKNGRIASYATISKSAPVEANGKSKSVSSEHLISGL
jgi:hypothetical protein